MPYNEGSNKSAPRRGHASDYHPATLISGTQPASITWLLSCTVPRSLISCSPWLSLDASALLSITLLCVWITLKSSLLLVFAVSYLDTRKVPLGLLISKGTLSSSLLNVSPPVNASCQPIGNLPKVLLCKTKSMSLKMGPFKKSEIGRMLLGKVGKGRVSLPKMSSVVYLALTESQLRILQHTCTRKKPSMNELMKSLTLT
ncbi:MAG: hypothetical protein [Cressdnaviricota sp.]|nr:MAG: hypothetical protein [Cressdnaviricota sp.]AXQ66584.1 MAG: hypothetical protein [Cressdnaviricota sp.]